MAQEEGGVLGREEIDEGLEDANELDMKRRICQIQDQYHSDPRKQKNQRIGDTGHGSDRKQDVACPRRIQSFAKVL